MSGRRSDASLASLLLVNRLVDTGAEPLKASEFWPLLDAVDDPASLLNADDAAFRGLGVSTYRLRALLAAGTGLAIALEQLEQSGIWVLSPFDGSWPRQLSGRLGHAAPPLLFGAGEQSLLAEADRGVGVVGSRDVSETGAGVARAMGAWAAARSSAVVSGGARGVDQLAMAAAVQAGGHSIGVLADALATRVRDADTRRAVLDGRAVLVSPYAPTARFQASRALGRNKIIYALAALTVVVAADLESGGTWSGASEALRRGFGPLAVWRGDGKGPGNERLVAYGAQPLDSLADLEQVFNHT